MTDRIDAGTSVDLLVEAGTHLPADGTATVMADQGVENCNRDVDALVEAGHPAPRPGPGGPGVLQLADRGVVALAQARLVVPAPAGVRGPGAAPRRLLRRAAQRAHAALCVPGPDARRDVLRHGRKRSRPAGGATCRSPATTTGREQGKTVRGVRVTGVGRECRRRSKRPRDAGQVPCPLPGTRAWHSAKGAPRAAPRPGPSRVGWRRMARRELVRNRRNAVTQSRVPRWRSTAPGSASSRRCVDLHTSAERPSQRCARPSPKHRLRARPPHLATLAKLRAARDETGMASELARFRDGKGLGLHSTSKIVGRYNAGSPIDRTPGVLVVRLSVCRGARIQAAG